VPINLVPLNFSPCESLMEMAKYFSILDAEGRRLVVCGVADREYQSDREAPLQAGFAF